MTRRTYLACIFAVALLIIAASLIGTSAFSRQASSTAPQGGAAARQATAPNVKVRAATDAEFIKESKAALAKSHGRSSPRVKNPKLAQGMISPAMLSTLRAQKMVAETEHAQALAAMHTQAASGHTGSGASAPGAAQSGANSSGAGGAAAARNAPNAVRATRPGSVGPERTMSGTTPSMAGTPSNSVKPATTGTSMAGTPPTSVNTPHGTSRYGAAPAPVLSMICRGPGINTVNGKMKGTVFTPVQDGNLYTIKGCMFGNQQGQAYIFGPFHAQKLNLQIDFWSDNEIDARLDPNVSGENDQNNNVTLVVAPKGAAEMKASGFSFYAAREAVPVTSFPQSWAFVGDAFSGGVKIKAEYTSPIPSQSQGAGASSLVYRYFGDKFGPGHDYYTFEKLPPEWTSDSAQLFTYDSDVCAGIVTYKATLGNWDIEWDSVHPNDLVVTFAPTVCSGIWPPPPLPPFWAYSNRTVSTYAIKIWINGPRGTPSPLP